MAARKKTEEKLFTGRIHAPNESFSGVRHGLRFVAGVAQAEDLAAGAVAWFEQRGYRVGGAPAETDEDTGGEE